MPRKVIELGSPEFEYNFSNDFGPMENGVGYAIGQWLSMPEKLAAIDAAKADTQMARAGDQRDQEAHEARLQENVDQKAHRDREHERHLGNDAWGKIRDVGSGFANALKVLTPGSGRGTSSSRPTNSRIPQTGEVAPSHLIEQLTTELREVPVIDSFGNEAKDAAGKTKTKTERVPIDERRARERLEKAGIDPDTYRYRDKPAAAPEDTSGPVPTEPSQRQRQEIRDANAVFGTLPDLPPEERPLTRDETMTADERGGSLMQPDAATVAEWQRQGVTDPDHGRTMGDIEGERSKKAIPIPEVAAARAHRIVIAENDDAAIDALQEGGDPTFNAVEIINHLVVDPVERDEATKAVWTLVPKNNMSDRRNIRVLRVLFQQILKDYDARAQMAPPAAKPLYTMTTPDGQMASGGVDETVGTLNAQ